MATCKPESRVLIPASPGSRLWVVPGNNFGREHRCTESVITPRNSLLDGRYHIVVLPNKRRRCRERLDINVVETIELLDNRVDGADVIVLEWGKQKWSQNYSCPRCALNFTVARRSAQGMVVPCSIAATPQTGSSG